MEEQENSRLNHQEKKQEFYLPFSFAKQHGVYVANKSEQGVIIHYLAPLKPSVIKEIKRRLHCVLSFQEVPADQFEVGLAKAYEAGKSSALEAISALEEEGSLDDLMHTLPSSKDLLEKQDDAPIIKLINGVLTQAIKQKASDVHFETFEDELIIRFRVDGVLREILKPPRALSPLLVSRLKIMSKLDIAEKRLPQDGRIALKIAGRPVDVRVSTIPTHYGERIVLRLLDKNQAPLNLGKLGMLEEAQLKIETLISSPHGIILVTGPTGSGKTTTLYAALNKLNQSSRNIMTVEDPIEYYLPGVSQTQVNTKVNMSFAKGLRAILRQDPDVVMVGEIRDKETADMAVQASLTGHLVLSTLHTNSAIGAISRLRDMGVEPFLLSSTLVGVVAQRLVRRLCDHCKQEISCTEEEKLLLGVDGKAKEVFHYSPQGCSECMDLGYSGRMGIYEIIMIDDELASMVHASASEQAIESYTRKKSKSMRQDGWRRVLNGDTSIEEVLRVTTESV